MGISTFSFASSLMISADGFLLAFSCVATSGFVRDMDKASKGQESFETSGGRHTTHQTDFSAGTTLDQDTPRKCHRRRHTASVAYSLRFGTGRKKGAALLQTPGQSTSGFAITILPFSLRPQFFLTKPNLRSSLHDAPLIDSLSFFLTSQFVSDKLQEYLSCFPLTLTSKIAS